MTGVPMSESDVQEKQTEEAKNEEIGRMDMAGLGVLFKEERERQGLGREKISEVTRLRLFIIKALENEEWERLPQPVFVRGFIKTYAQALSLDEKEALELYEGSGGAKMAEPKIPLESLKSGTWRLVLVVFLLVLAGLAIFLYLTKPSLIFMTDPSKEGRPSTEQIDQPVPPEKTAEKAQVKDVEAVPDAGGPDVVQTSGDSKPEPEALPFEDQPAVTANEVVGMEKISMVPEGAEPTESTAEPIPASNKEHVLQAVITERTWVRVYVDNEDPQEFIFQPGSNPQWTAREGFNLIVGNAAGITLDFNGNRVENLGNIGQVIRLFLPKDFRSDKYED